MKIITYRDRIFRITLGRFQLYTFARGNWPSLGWHFMARPEFIAHGYTLASGQFQREPGGFWHVVYCCPWLELNLSWTVDQ